MKKIVFSLLLGMFFVQGVFGQTQLINNGGFESGPGNGQGQDVTNATGWKRGCGLYSYTQVGTPDLLDKDEPFNSYAGIPNNGIGARNTPNGRYVQLLSSSTDPALRGETIETGLNAALSASNLYTVSFYTARSEKFWWENGSTILPDCQMEVVLRVANNCTLEKVVYTSPILPKNNTGNSDNTYVTNLWYQQTGTFNLTQQDINMGYNAIEFRIKGIAKMFHPVFIDDVSLISTPMPQASFVFTNPGQTVLNMPSVRGSTTAVTQICETLPKTCVTIDASASTGEDRYYVSITPWDLSTWQPTGTALFNNWVCTGCTAPSFKNLCDLTNINSLSFLPGVVYKVEVAVGLALPGSYSSQTKFIRINALPVLNVSNQTICSSSNAIFNVTTNKWPIVVENTANGATIGTFTANPIVIVLTPSITTSYSFTSTSSSGCSVTKNATVTVIQTQNQTITGPSTVASSEVNGLTFIGAMTSGTCYKHAWFIQECTSNETPISSVPEYASNWSYSNPGTFTFNSSTTGHNPMPSVLPCGRYYRIKLVTWSSATNGCYKEVTKVVYYSCSAQPSAIASNDNSNENINSGLGTKLTSSEVSISPSPTNGKFNIKLNDVTAEKVVVYNMLGKVVSETSVTENAKSLDIDLSELPASLYLVHVHAVDEVILKKVIKE
jgi:hypothetical protein